MVTSKAKHSDIEAAEAIRPTCFVMMPIADAEGYQPGHFGEVYTQLIEPAVNEAGYDCQLATSTSSAHMIHLEVVTKVATADLCICDLSTNNPNVLFEYGIRQAFDKPTVLIKDDKTHRIFDVSIFRDIEYDHTLRISNILAKRAAIVKAIQQTVEGSADESQVFSLVKLMKITKAALPSGEVSRDDARFALIERQLDTISSKISLAKGDLPGVRQNLSGMNLRRGGSAGNTFARFEIGDVQISITKSGVAYRNSKSGETHVVGALSELERSAWWAFLDDNVKNKVLAEINLALPIFSLL